MYNKYVSIGHNIYQMVEPNRCDIKGAVSLRNIMTQEFIRHRDGNIFDSTYEENTLFLTDSTFKIELGENKVLFYCTNLGLESYCITCNSDNTIRITEYIKYFPVQDKNKYLFNLMNESDIYAKDNAINLDKLNEKRLIVFGSSSSEIFDYVFGDNERYLPFWASGWSARGLYKTDEHMAPYRSILDKVSKDSIILLHFGSVDVDFNLPYKLINNGFYDITSFIKEMVNGVLCLKEYLNHLGFENVYSVFTAPPIVLPDEYWNSFPHLGVIPPLVRGKVLWDFSVCLSSFMQVINCLPDLVESINYPVCNKLFIRDTLDHHINFIAIQDIVYDKLKDIDGMLSRREVKHQALYRHLACDVFFVKKNNKPRLRTCR